MLSMGNYRRKVPVRFSMTVQLNNDVPLRFKTNGQVSASHNLRTKVVGNGKAHKIASTKASKFVIKRA